MKNLKHIRCVTDRKTAVWTSLFAVLVLVCVPSAHAQVNYTSGSSQGVQTYPGQPLPARNPAAAEINNMGISGGAPHSPEIAERQVLGRNAERQRKLVEDTDKLLQLATQLKTDVDKTNKDILSVDVVKRAEEIEKLAKSVKERMKG